MEAQTTPQIQTPAPMVVQNTQPTTTDMSYDDGGALGSITSGKMNIKDIAISALLITLTVFGIFYYRNGMKKLDEQLTSEEIDDIYDKLDEHEENLKRAMGKNYKSA